MRSSLTARTFARQAGAFFFAPRSPVHRSIRRNTIEGDGMSPSRRVWSGAGLSFALVWLSIVVLSGRAAAQSSPFYDDAVRSAGLFSEDLDRSPALQGMGRLTLVGEDPHHRLTLWDFARNPAGVWSSDSTSTLDLRPGAVGGSDVATLSGASPGAVRESFAARGATTGFEGWRRDGPIAYGAIGSLGSLRTDVPYNDDLERRLNYSGPWVTPVISGRVPYVSSGRTRYALSLHVGSESVDAKYLKIVDNAAGQFISLNSEMVNPPNVFLPESYSVRELGGGVSVSQVFASWLTAALGYDGVGVQIDGDSPDKRNSSQTHEMRPYNTGQATFVGRMGRNLEWAADGKAWTSSSETAWNFTISAGQGSEPLNGRGKYQTRDERGSAMHTRALYHAGRFDIGADLGTNYRKVTVLPPAIDDRTSFNYFINTVYYRLGADSLMLPDSVSRSVTQLNAWQAGGGVAMRLGGRGGRVGIEYHYVKQRYNTEALGAGPQQVAWDIRSGAEYRVADALMGRLGYQYRRNDEDTYTYGNDQLAQLATLGVSVSPQHASWVFDLSYGLQFLSLVDWDPLEPHGSRQMLTSQVHWSF
jgi:opacity protein-like surface antigen